MKGWGMSFFRHEKSPFKPLLSQHWRKTGSPVRMVLYLLILSFVVYLLAQLRNW
jgi:hypothetical protein